MNVCAADFDDLLSNLDFLKCMTAFPEGNCCLRKLNAPFSLSYLKKVQREDPALHGCDQPGRFRYHRCKSVRTICEEGKCEKRVHFEKRKNILWSSGKTLKDLLGQLQMAAEKAW